MQCPLISTSGKFYKSLRKRLEENLQNILQKKFQDNVQENLQKCYKKNLQNFYK